MKKTRKNDRAFKEKAVELSHNRKNPSEFAQEHNLLPVQLYKWRREQEDFGPGSFLGNEKLKQAPKQEPFFEIEKKRIEGVDPVIARGIVDVAEAFHSVSSMRALFSKEV